MIYFLCNFTCKLLNLSTFQATSCVDYNKLCLLCLFLSHSVFSLLHLVCTLSLPAWKFWLALVKGTRRGWSLITTLPVLRCWNISLNQRVHGLPIIFQAAFNVEVWDNKLILVFFSQARPHLWLWQKLPLCQSSSCDSWDTNKRKQTHPA